MGPCPADQPDLTPNPTPPNERIPHTQVEVSSSRPPFSHFLVKLCAISGGVFSVSRIVDNFFYYSGFLFAFGPKTQGFITPR